MATVKRNGMDSHRTLPFQAARLKVRGLFSKVKLVIESSQGPVCHVDLTDHATRTSLFESSTKTYPHRPYSSFDSQPVDSCTFCKGFSTRRLEPESEFDTMLQHGFFHNSISSHQETLKLTLTPKVAAPNQSPCRSYRNVL